MNRDDRTGEIQRDIERTQREISRTVDEIQYRLSPHTIMERTKDSVRRAGVNTSRSMVDKIKSNPIPAAMAAVGLWLLFRDSNKERQYAYEYDIEFLPETEFDEFDPAYARPSRLQNAKEKVSGSMHTAAHRVEEAVDTAKEKTSEKLHQAEERAAYLRRKARYQARHLREEAGDVMRENPLVGGLAALAVGALLGASIPETEKENEVLGPYRDELADRAREKTHEATDRARRMASTAAQAVTEAVKQEARNSSQGSGNQQTAGRSDFPNVPPSSSTA
jgi:ElaB/YqjD/DUF883 family membrane-anchored ribosome-binding protein